MHWAANLFGSFRAYHFIALTGDSGNAKAAEALAAGMDDYVTKPVQPDVLGAKLLRLFSRDPAFTR